MENARKWLRPAITASALALLACSHRAPIDDASHARPSGPIAEPTRAPAPVTVRTSEPPPVLSAAIAASAVAGHASDAPATSSHDGEQIGLASFYGKGFAGRKTANGEIFDPSELTCAHRKHPFGTWLRVTNLQNGKAVEVRVNDRGPYAGKRVIDLSEGAARKIDLIQSGVAKVRIEVIHQTTPH